MGEFPGNEAHKFQGDAATADKDTNYVHTKRAEDCKSNRKSKMDGTNKVLFK